MHFRRVLKEINPDIIHVHLVSKYPLVIYPEIKDYPVFQTMHGPTFFCPSGWGNYRSNCKKCTDHASLKCYTSGCCSFIQALLAAKLYRDILHLFKETINVFHTPSAHLADSMKNWGFPNVKHIPLGLDHVFLEQPVLSWPRKKNILYIGALAESKGVDILIDAFAGIVKVFPDAHLQIAGRGALESSLKDRIKFWKIEKNVEMLGFADRKKVLSLYQNAYMFVMPSVWFEAFGLVIPEALACQTPCVGSDVGGISEQLKETGFGFVVPPRDSHALAEKIIYLLNHPDEAQKMGQMGREYVLKKYDPDQYINELEKEFNMLIEEKGNK